MFCRACGKQLPDESKFCTYCGVEAIISQPQPTLTPPQAPAHPVVTNPASHGKRKPILIAAGAVILTGLLVLCVLLINKATQYKDAVSLMETGKYEQAIETLGSLKDYRDSEALLTECENRRVYEQAAALMADEDYPKAFKLFTSLGEYENSAQQAHKCSNTMDYKKAVAFMQGGNHKQAHEIFKKLGSFSDSADMAKQCQLQMDYDRAMALYNAASYQQALGAFKTLGTYMDSQDLALKCQYSLEYIAAEAAYAEGKYNTAYMLFSAMPDFSDSIERAAGCIQETPDTGESYRNSEYKSKTCPLKIKTPDDGLNTYLKVYSTDKSLVSCAFISPGKSVRISLPAGSYQINVATGTYWFGEEEMFGRQNASYGILTFDNGAIIAQLERNYTYTLTLRNAEDGNVGSNTVDPGSF